MKIGDKVIATAGPYEGRHGTIEDQQANKFVVKFPATTYDGACSGLFDARWLRVRS